VGAHGSASSSLASGLSRLVVMVPPTVATGTGYLGYGLFSDSQRQQPWGDGGASGARVSGTVTTSLLALVCLPGNRSHTVYGRLPASQNVPAGAYTDSVMLTVTY
jgi:spore coat protein U-like protein